MKYLALLIPPLLGSLTSSFFAIKGSQLISCLSGFFGRKLGVKGRQLISCFSSLPSTLSTMIVGLKLGFKNIPVKISKIKVNIKKYIYNKKVNFFRHITKIKVNIYKYRSKLLVFLDKRFTYIVWLLIVIVAPSFLFTNLYIFTYNISINKEFVSVTNFIIFILLTREVINNKNKLPHKLSFLKTINFMYNNKGVTLFLYLFRAIIMNINHHYYKTCVIFESDSVISTYIFYINLFITSYYIVRFITNMFTEWLKWVSSSCTYNAEPYRPNFLPYNLNINIFDLVIFMSTISIVNFGIKPIIFEKFIDIITIKDEIYNKYYNNVKNLISIAQDLYNKLVYYVKYLISIPHDLYNKFKCYVKDLISRDFNLYNKLKSFVKYKAILNRRMPNLHLHEYKYTGFIYKDVFIYINKLNTRIGIPVEYFRISEKINILKYKNSILHQTKHAFNTKSLIKTKFTFGLGSFNYNKLIHYWESLSITIKVKIRDFSYTLNISERYELSDHYNNLSKNGKYNFIINSIKHICNIDKALVLSSGNSNPSFNANFNNDKANMLGNSNNNVNNNTIGNMGHGRGKGLDKGLYDLSKPGKFNPGQITKNDPCRFNPFTYHLVHDNTTYLCIKGLTKLNTWAIHYRINISSLLNDIMDKNITCKSINKELLYNRYGILIYSLADFNYANILQSLQLSQVVIKIAQLVSNVICSTYNEPIIVNDHLIGLNQNIKTVTYSEIKNQLMENEVSIFNIAILSNKIRFNLNLEQLTSGQDIVLFDVADGFRFLNRVLDIVRINNIPRDYVLLSNIPDYWSRLDDCAYYHIRVNPEGCRFPIPSHNRNQQYCKYVINKLYDHKQYQVSVMQFIEFIKVLQGLNLNCEDLLFMYSRIYEGYFIKTPYPDLDYKPRITESPEVNLLLDKIARYCSDYMRQVISTPCIKINYYNIHSPVILDKTCEKWKMTFRDIIVKLPLDESEIIIICKLFVSIDTSNLKSYITNTRINLNFPIFNDEFFYDIINQMYNLNTSNALRNIIHLNGRRRDWDIEYQEWETLPESSNYDFGVLLLKKIMETAAANHTANTPVTLSDIITKNDSPILIKLKNIFSELDYNETPFKRKINSVFWRSAVIYSNLEIDGLPGISIINIIKQG